MKQIITLEKEIAFKTMLGDITSISLEPDLAFINDSEIEGNLIISGTYKMTEASTLEEDFNYKVPVEIMLTTSLAEDKRKVDINNFTYEIVNEEALAIKVELLIEGLEKIEIEEDDNLEEVRNSNEEKEEIEVLTTNDLENTTEDVSNIMNDNKKEEVSLVMDDTVKEEISTVMNEEVKEELPALKEDTNNKQVMDSIFSAFANTDETYATYSVYILREDDNLEEVMAKYKTNRETLEEYNDLSNLKVGSKLIIPTTREVND